MIVAGGTKEIEKKESKKKKGRRGGCKEREKGTNEIKVEGKKVERRMQ